MTDIPTTWGTWGPAHWLVDQTQWLQLGPFGPWSPSDTDSWPEWPNRVRHKRLCWSFPFPSSLKLDSFPLFETFEDPTYFCVPSLLVLRPEQGIVEKQYYSLGARTLVPPQGIHRMTWASCTPKRKVIFLMLLLEITEQPRFLPCPSFWLNCTLNTIPDKLNIRHSEHNCLCGEDD